jgi:hypothetical protein
MNKAYNFREAPPNEAEKITPEFLAQQARLPRDQWSEEFKIYIDEIIQENIRMRERKWTEEERSSSPEAEEEITYERYLSGLRLDEAELRDKVILDLGSGDGEFVKYCIDKGITQNAYGIEARLANENNPVEEAGHDQVKIDERYRKNFFAQNYGKEFPVHNADYVISMASVTNMDWDGEEWKDVVTVLQNSLAALKESGEVRLWPIQEPAEATPVEGENGINQAWKEKLDTFASENHVQWELRPTGVIVTGNNNDQIYLNSVLILRKQKP